MSRKDFRSQVEQLDSDVKANGDKLSIDAAVLLSRFGVEELDEATASEISRELKQRGINATPKLKRLLQNFGKQIADDQLDEESYVCSASDLAGSNMDLTRGSTLALRGAVGVTVVATVAGFFAFWMYGLVALLIGAAATALLLVVFSRLDRALPMSFPRGQTLGVVVAGAFLLVFGLAICLPIRQIRTNHAKESKAQNFLNLANAAVNANNAPQATDLLQQAMIADPSYSPILATALRVQTLELKTNANLLDAQVSAYENARRLLDSGDTAAAAELFYSIRGLRDVDAILAKHALIMAQALQAKAKQNLLKNPSDAAHFADLSVLISPSKKLVNSSSKIADKARKLAAAKAQTQAKVN